MHIRNKLFARALQPEKAPIVRIFRWYTSAGFSSSAHNDGRSFVDDCDDDLEKIPVAGRLVTTGHMNDLKKIVVGGQGTTGSKDVSDMLVMKHVEWETSSGLSYYPEDYERKCELEVKARVGSDSNLPLATSNATRSWKELKKQNTKYQKVTKGDVIDLREFLFTEYRDYLIRYNDNTKVKAEQLAGKVILLYFVSLSLYPLARLHEKSNTSLLMDIFNHLLHTGDFEIVFIAVDDGNERESEELFEYIFCGTPWTAIPFSDVICRRSLQINFHVNDTTTSFVVDPTGMVLQRDAISIIEEYGVMGFPFSDERIELLNAEDEVFQQPSLLTLLGSSQRDYVITNTGEKVPIHSLEEKVVALFFYEDGFCSCKEYIIGVYEELARTKENFEVVLIYLTDTPTNYHCTNEEAFWKAFLTMPWLALPYKDPTNQKLKRIFEYYDYDNEYYDYDNDHFNERPEIVIFGPHGEFIEPFGNCIMGVFPVYPFTCENAAKFETKRVQDLKMEMLWDANMIFKRIDGSQMTFSQLTGKRVILFFEMEWGNEKDHYFLVKLKERYLELKGTHDEFEVIHILEKEMDPMLPIQDLPWLVTLASELLPDSFNFYESCGNDYHYYGSSLLAFDRDGKLVRRTTFPAFENADFPFYAGSMLEEALSQLIHLYGWDYWNFYPNGGRIYTLHKKLRQPRSNLGGGYRVWSFNAETTSFGSRNGSELE